MRSSVQVALVFPFILILACQPPPPKVRTVLTGEIILPGITHKPIAMAIVQVEQKNKIIDETTSDGNGRFMFVGLPDDEFDLLISKGDLYVPYRFSEENLRTLNVKDFKNGRQFLQIIMSARPTVLSGKILSANTREPVAGVTITTYPPTIKVITDKKGLYRLESDRFEDSPTPYALVVSPLTGFEPEQIFLENLILAQENEVSPVELRPHLLGEGVEEGSVEHDVHPGTTTQGEK